MREQERVAVIGAGVIGAAVAFALAREGRTVTLVDRAPPGEGGASYGNAGHLAVELVEPLPSPALLYGFWRDLFPRGALHVPARRLGRIMPWALLFARAAYRRAANTRHLAPFVRPGVTALAQLLHDAGRPGLLRRNGHYEVWLDGDVDSEAAAQAAAMNALDVPKQPAPRHHVESVRAAAHAARAAGLWFPQCAHVLDPLEVVRAFAAAAVARGATLERRTARAIQVTSAGYEVITDADPVVAGTVVICLGAWSAPLLRPFGLRVPLEAARGYHVRMSTARALVDAPVVYASRKILVTPMTGHVRATSFMEFADADAPADPRKAAWLRARVQALGYACDAGTPAWVGPRPVLPDYLPAIGRVPGAPGLFYSFGHQHIGLTLSGVNALAMADLVAGRGRPDLEPFDLRRFGP
jgi:D-amino-acid dehydrogenase